MVDFFTERSVIMDLYFGQLCVVDYCDVFIS